MRPTLIMATVTAATIGFGTAAASAEDIALSLVHPKGRIDIPVGAVKQVNSEAISRVRNTETGEVHEYKDPHVDVCLAAEFRERICQLTQQIVDEPLAIVLIVRRYQTRLCANPSAPRAAFASRYSTSLTQPHWRSGFATERIKRAPHPLDIKTKNHRAGRPRQSSGLSR
jgi:hypothetical protein